MAGVGKRQRQRVQEDRYYSATYRLMPNYVDKESKCGDKPGAGPSAGMARVRLRVAATRLEMVGVGFEPAKE